MMSDPSRILSTTQRNLCGIILETAARMGDHPALIANGGRGGEQVTYVQLADRVKRLSAGLQSAEFSAITHIGILSHNCPEWCVAYLAILGAGKTVVPIDANLKQAEINHIIEDAHLNVVFLSPDRENDLHLAYPHVRLLTFEPAGQNSWTRILGNPIPKLAPPAQAAVMIYTSGATGASKVVLLTHENLLANLEGVEPSLEFGSYDHFLSVLPLHHTFEGTCGFLTPLANGATIIYARSLKSKEILEDISTNRITIMCGVPLLFEKMYHGILRKIEQAPIQRRIVFHTLFFLSGVGWKLGRKWGRALFRPIRQRAGIDSIRMFVSGGAPLPPTIARFFNLFGIDFLQGYGLTECSPVVAVNRPHDIEFGSVGVPLPNLEIRIDHPDELGVGEILVKGPSVMAGYHNNPRETAAAIVDGWMHTGDLGRWHNNHLWITGRKKNVIVSAAGKNIYPEELEEKLLASPFISEVVVFGRSKDGRQGEEVRAIIVPDLEQYRSRFGWEKGSEDGSVIEKDIATTVESVNSHLSDFKRIIGYDIQYEELEKTSTKKIKRFVYSPR
jgi:long-chain acyl-CoA synthetase